MVHEIYMAALDDVTNDEAFSTLEVMFRLTSGPDEQKMSQVQKESLRQKTLKTIAQN